MNEKLQVYEVKMEKDTGKPGRRAGHNTCRPCQPECAQ